MTNMCWAVWFALFADLCEPDVQTCSRPAFMESSECGRYGVREPGQGQVCWPASSRCVPREQDEGRAP